MLDLKNNFDVISTAAPSARTATFNSTGVDLANYDGAMVVIHPGTITDGTHTPTLQESSDNSTFSAVAASDMIGTLAAIATNTVQRVGYIGSKRYIRLNVTVAGATTGGVYGANVVRGVSKKKPL